MTELEREKSLRAFLAWVKSKEGWAHEHMEPWYKHMCKVHRRTLRRIRFNRLKRRLLGWLKREEK